MHILFVQWTAFFFLKVGVEGFTFVHNKLILQGGRNLCSGHFCWNSENTKCQFKLCSCFL